MKGVKFFWLLQFGKSCKLRYDRFQAFFGIFWPIEQKFFMGTQETIIYRLVLKNLGFGPYLLFSIFWVLTKGVAPQGPQNPTKKLNHLVDILGHLLSRNHVSNFFDLGTPPLPKENLFGT